MKLSDNGDHYASVREAAEVLVRLHALTPPETLQLPRLSPFQSAGQRDAQIILGHAHISTQQIYTHVDEAARLDALTRLNTLLGGDA